MTIGERIAFFRKTYKITQKMFANSLGISQSHISKIENNQDNPSNRLLQKITATWGIRKEWLLNEEGEMIDGDTKLQVNKSQCLTAIDTYMHNYGENSTNDLSGLILKLIHIAETYNFFVTNKTFDDIASLNNTFDQFQKLLNFWVDEIQKNGSIFLSSEESEIAYKEFSDITRIYYGNIIRAVDSLCFQIIANANCFSAYLEEEFNEEQKNS